MARGWESKSVESQIDEGRDTPKRRSSPKPPEEIDRDRKRKSLEMSRRRILSELESTKSAARRTSLEAALKHLDAELAKV